MHATHTLQQYAVAVDVPRESGCSQYRKTQTASSALSAIFSLLEEVYAEDIESGSEPPQSFILRVQPDITQTS